MAASPFKDGSAEAPGENMSNGLPESTEIPFKLCLNSVQLFTRIRCSETKGSLMMLPQTKCSKCLCPIALSSLNRCFWGGIKGCRSQAPVFLSF